MVWAASQGRVCFQVEEQTGHQLALRTGISLTVAHTRLHYNMKILAVDIAHRVSTDLSWHLSTMNGTAYRVGNAEPLRPRREQNERRECFYGSPTRGRTISLLRDLPAAC